LEIADTGTKTSLRKDLGKGERRKRNCKNLSDPRKGGGSDQGGRVPKKRCAGRGEKQD